MRAALFFLLCLLLACQNASAQPRPADSRYPWSHKASAETIHVRFAPPDGFRRIALSPESFGEWLRNLPLKPAGSLVTLYNGLPKLNQFAHSAVVDIDIGRRDLQQCADAVIRLRAEYLFATGCENEVAFHFTSGDLATWSRWRKGERPRVNGNRVSWEPTSKVNGSYTNFRDYLDQVFTYAGSLSLQKELAAVQDRKKILPGDVFIRGGSPGHAVIVADVAENELGDRVFLLAQSYMPAQEIQLLNNPVRSDAWYVAKREGRLVTPEWEFSYEDLRRFPAGQCGR